MSNFESCPFCGEINQIKLLTYGRPPRSDIYQVKCLSCGCSTSYHCHACDAISTWNKRVKHE